MVWQMRWLNKSIAIINITFQLLDVYKKTESHYPLNLEFVLSKFRINPIKSILNKYKKIYLKKKKKKTPSSHYLARGPPNTNKTSNLL